MKLKLLVLKQMGEPSESYLTEGGDNELRRSILLQQIQQQQRVRTKIRQQKLKLTVIGYIIVLGFFVLLQMIGITIFTQGFLLSRQVLPNISHCEVDSLSETSPCLQRPIFQKAIILVIDALRYDFTIPIEGSKKYYHNNFPILYESVQNDPEKAFLLKFMSDPPTTTLQRLKGLTTGTLPTFVDAGSNFNGDSIDEDNWMLQLHEHNKTIAFMGDDTWVALFDKYIDPKLKYPYESLNVWDLHTIDNGVVEHLMPLLLKENSSQWDVLIGHFLGVDHVGHRYGPDHFTMKDKLNQMNNVIKDVINKLDSDTLLIVMGDHGMDSTGNHGGDSPDEIESTLFMYSKKKSFQLNKIKNSYKEAKNEQNHRFVNQIDLVPTISLLLGVPIPYNNLGFPIEEAFNDREIFKMAALKTMYQIQKFRDSSSEIDINLEVSDIYSRLIEEYHSSKKHKLSFDHIIEQTRKFQKMSLEECKILWARFDLFSITVGILVLLISLLFIATYSRSMPPIRLLTMSFDFIGSIIAMSLLGIVISFSIFIVLKPTWYSLKKCMAIGGACGILIGLWAPIMDKFSVEWIFHQISDFFRYNLNIWSFLGILFTVLHALIFASNSFIVWEDKVVLFLILSFGFSCLVVSAFKSGLSKQERIMGILHSITFMLLSRLVSTITLCREEQGALCSSNFKTSWWSIILLYLMTLILPSVIKSFYELSDSYYSAAPLWINIGLRYLLILNAVYWTIEYLESNELLLGTTYMNAMSPITKSVKIAMARIVLFTGLVLATFFWSKGPLCILLSEKKKDVIEGSESSSNPLTGLDKESMILGYRNVYGSTYFLFVMNISVAIMMVTKPLGAISLAMLLVQILSMLELADILHFRHSIVSPVILGLLGFQHFFSTGHQATIPSIQWELGFMTTESIVFPFTHINIILNTFGSFIIVCLCVPLLTLWKVPPSSKPVTLLSYILTNITTLIAYETMINLSSIIFAAHFRRHLMVWKIFAPRYMLSGLLMVITDLTLVTLSIWFCTTKVLTQVNRIFGK